MEARPGSLGHRLRDPEVGQVQVIGVRVVVAPLDQQVRRLDVAVDETTTVRGVKRPGGLAEQEDRGAGLQSLPLLQYLPQVGPRDAAHRDIQQPVARPRVVNGDDVWVVHRRRDSRFLKETRAE